MSAAQPPNIDPTAVPVPVHREHLTQAPRWTRALCITIDGPAGSGKSTVARLLAERLGFQYIDTGATYRAVAWLALDRGIPLDDEARLRGLAIAQPVTLGYSGGRWIVRISGVDVTDLIREPRIDEASSMIARHEGVRDVLVARQRQLSIVRDSVLDGRDCGTRVRPDADAKFAITADFDERVRRRTGQFGRKEAKGLATQIRERDARDAPQSAAAADAILIDTTDIDIQTTVDQMVERFLQRRSELFDDEVTCGRTARSWIQQDLTESFPTVRKRIGWLFDRGFRLRTHGVERVPDGPCLFIANHSSVWDSAFVIMALHRPIRYMAKSELMSTRVISRLGDSVGMFPVRRGAGDRVALHIAESVLRRGDSLGIFPEGTRVYEGKLRKPKHGAARLALVTNVPIVPVAIYGTRWNESPGTVNVTFGAAHHFDGMTATPANIASATDIVWSDVNELWSAMRNGRGV